MQTKLIAAGTVLVVVLASLVLIFARNGGGSSPSSPNGSTTAPPVLFAGSQVAKYSYLISTQNISPEAQTALAGYTVNDTPQPDGSTNVTITVNLSGASQTLNVKQGYKLYVVETSFGDDSGNYDSSFSDDGFVLVNQSGYMV